MADKAELLGGVKIAAITGKILGAGGALLTAVESARDKDGFTFGDGVKVAIGLATTFTPYGWVYGAIDLGVGIISGTTVTDQIGGMFDNEIKKHK